MACSNHNSINALIARKISNVPFYATREQAQSITTDMDHFPYKRFFRGVAYSHDPVIMDRQAGFRARHDNCYKAIHQVNPVKHEFCWEYPCSGVKPCSKNLCSGDGEKKKCTHFVVAP